MAFKVLLARPFSPKELIIGSLKNFPNQRGNYALNFFDYDNKADIAVPLRTYVSRGFTEFFIKFKLKDALHYDVHVKYDEKQDKFFIVETSQNIKTKIKFIIEN